MINERGCQIMTYNYNPANFGADGIRATPNWRNSGYTHYTAYSNGGGQISWNEIQEMNGPRQVVDMHLSSWNIRNTPNP